MKLKKHIEVRYDDDKKEFIFTPFETSKIKKVTSRFFPILNNKSDWNGVGGAVLDRVGLTDFEPIDIYYTVRGAVAEYLAKLFIERMYKEKLGVDIQTISFTPEDVGYDNFKPNPRFGGVIDIAIKSPQEYRAVIEVKSKSLKDHEKIIVNKQVPEEEKQQGLMLAHLSKVDKLLMVYVFFDETQEKILKSYVYATQNDTPKPTPQEIAEGLNFTIDNVMIKPVKFDVNHEQVERDMQTAYENLHRIAKQNGVISKIHFKQKEIDYLFSVVPLSDLKSELKSVSEDDLPF